MIKLHGIRKKSDASVFTHIEKQSLKIKEETAPQLLFCFMGFAAGSFSAFEDMSPFAPALMSAVPFTYCLAAFSGACIGTFASFGLKEAVRYTASIIIISLSRLLFARRFREKECASLTYVIAFTSTIFTGLIYLWAEELYLLSFLILIAEGIITLASSFLLLSAFSVPLYKGGLVTMGRKATFSLIISLMIFILCACNVEVGGISPVRTGLLVLLMLLSLYKGMGILCVAGLLCALPLCLLPDCQTLIYTLPLSCLAAGALSFSGQTLVALSFSGAYIILSLIPSLSLSSPSMIIEPLVASVIFLLIPSYSISSLCQWADSFLFPVRDEKELALSETLTRASENMSTAAQIVVQVSDRLDKIINPEINRLFSRLQQRVCDKCEKKPLCWNRDFDSTARDILSVLGVEPGRDSKLPLSATCKRYDLLCAGLTELYPSYSSAMATKNKIKEMRQVLTDEFFCVSDFLRELSLKLGAENTPDRSLSSLLSSALRDSGIPVEELICCNNEGRMHITATIYGDASPYVKALHTVAQLLTKRRFEMPEAMGEGSAATLLMKERAPYKVSCGYAQRPLKPGAVCGDSLCFFTTQSGIFNAIISDGMGTGSRAAVDSNMTVSLAEKLIMSGFSLKGAISFINSAMIIKSTDESTATVDAVRINPYTAQAQFVKAGACVTFIRNGDKVESIEKASMPIGILRELSLADEKRNLEKGAIILLLSDGAIQQDCCWINDELLAWSKSDMSSLASHIASLARLRCPKGEGDDISVMALRLEDRG